MTTCTQVCELCELRFLISPFILHDTLLQGLFQNTLQQYFQQQDEDLLREPREAPHHLHYHHLCIVWPYPHRGQRISLQQILNLK